MERKEKKQKMRKYKEWISLHFLFIFSFPLHFLAAQLPGCNKLCNPDPSYAIALIKKNCWSQKTSRKTLLDTKCFRTICISAMYCIIQALWLDHTNPVSKLLNHIPRDIYLKYWLHRLVGEGIVRQYCGTTTTHGTPSTYKPLFPSLMIIPSGTVLQIIQNNTNPSFPLWW